MNFKLVLSDEELPVQIFFNSIPDVRFVETIELLSRLVGSGFNDVICEFPDEDNQFEGVRFCLPDEEITVSPQNFAAYVKSACEAFLAKNPSEFERLNLILSRFHHAGSHTLRGQIPS